MSAVFLDTATVTQGELDFSALETAIGPWTYYPHTPPAEVVTRLAEAEVVVANKVVLDARSIAAAGALRLICVAATGYNNVDLAAASDRNIVVCNVRAYATPSVVQHVFMVMLNLLGRYNEYQQLVKAGGWSRSPHFCPLNYPFHELQGKKLGIIGFGELGHGVAHVARAFGMQVLVAAHRGRPAGNGRSRFDDVLRQADVISLHCPLNDATRNLISARELALMPSHAILINAARGGVVDESALADALLAGRIGGAAVDVLTQEPPALGNVLLDLNLPNLIVTPHIAWASLESRQRLINEVAANIAAYRKGKIRNRVINPVTD